MALIVIMIVLGLANVGGFILLCVYALGLDFLDFFDGSSIKFESKLDPKPFFNQSIKAFPIFHF